MSKCDCPECITYFNEDIKRPIIEISEEDKQRVDKFLNGFKFKSYCDRHTPLDSNSKVIICKYEYCGYKTDKDIEISYKYEGCQIKAFIILTDDGRYIESAWGICSSNN